MMHWWYVKTLEVLLIVEIMEDCDLGVLFILFSLKRIYLFYCLSHYEILYIWLIWCLLPILCHVCLFVCLFGVMLLFDVRYSVTVSNIGITLEPVSIIGQMCGCR
jgi:hypothetical protein